MNQRLTQGKNKEFTKHDFTIQQQIGYGRFACVSKARSKLQDFTVAMKIMTKECIQTKKIYKQVKRQVQIQHRLNHPNICQLFAYFHDEKYLYIILEYCANGSLAKIIKQKRQKLEEKVVAKIALQLFYALAYMHQRNVNHRDLKLQNILLDQHNNIKISDFGCCRHYPLERNTFCGTLQYMAPEMVNKKTYNHSIDIYCVGVILYQIFYFISPFAGQDKDETYENIKKGRYIYRDQIRQISSQAKHLISILLQKDPIKRPKAKDLFNHDFILKYTKQEEIVNIPLQINENQSQQNINLPVNNLQQEIIDVPEQNQQEIINVAVQNYQQEIMNLSLLNQLQQIINLPVQNLQEPMINHSLQIDRNQQRQQNIINSQQYNRMRQSLQNIDLLRNSEGPYEQNRQQNSFSSRLYPDLQ